MEAVLAAIVEPQEREQRTQERFDLRALRSVAWLNDFAFKQNFRVSRTGFEKLYLELGPLLKQGGTKFAISVETKLLLTLRALAQGSYQLGVGNDMHLCVSQSSVSNILSEVLDVMNNSFCPKYITFPSFARMTTIAASFLHQCGMPNVIGLIDGTHIRIAVGPKPDPNYPEFVYVNRKNFYSINAQIICDHDCRITAVNARYPGAAHDSFIWRYCSIRQHLLDNYSTQNVWLLGDSGYPIEPILLTPYGTPDTEAQERFNQVLRKCRNGSERCIGILKARWRCLLGVRALHYHPTKVGKIVNACAALHNFCLDMDDDYIDVEPNIDEEVPNGDPPVVHDEIFTAGCQSRENVAHYLMGGF